MPEYAAVFLDLDGTVITPERGITDEEREAVKRCQNAGISVYISTGRSVRGTVYVHEDLGTDAPCFSYNGAVVYDPIQGSHLVHHRLGDGVCEALYAQAGADDLAMLCFHEEEIWAHRHPNPALTGLAKRLEKSGVRWVDAREQLPQKGLTKVWVLADSDAADRLEASTAPGLCHWIRPRMGGILAGTGLELLAGTAAPRLKAEPLHYIQRTRGIAIHQMVAIGDHDNDVEALKTAGLGVAVSGATPQALQAADERIGAAEDGAVARFLEALARS